MTDTLQVSEFFERQYRKLDYRAKRDILFPHINFGGKTDLEVQAEQLEMLKERYSFSIAPKDFPMLKRYIREHDFDVVAYILSIEFMHVTKKINGTTEYANKLPNLDLQPSRLAFASDAELHSLSEKIIYCDGARDVELALLYPEICFAGMSDSEIAAMQLDILNTATGENFECVDDLHTLIRHLRVREDLGWLLDSMIRGAMEGNDNFTSLKRRLTKSK